MAGGRGVEPRFAESESGVLPLNDPPVLSSEFGVGSSEFKIRNRIIDSLVKSPRPVTPAEAGVQNSLNSLDSRFRWNDKNGEIATFYEIIIN